MRRLANGRERDPLCSCKHGPAVHYGGQCVFSDTCGCPIWNPVPYVYDEDKSGCPRCRALEAQLQAREQPVALPIPQQRQPSPSETQTPGQRSSPPASRWAEQVRRPDGRFGSRADAANNRGGR